MKDSELKMVADHMGHNGNIHTDVYKLQSSILEKAKVAQLLIAMENGAIAKFKDQTVENITQEGKFSPVLEEQRQQFYYLLSWP